MTEAVDSKSNTSQRALAQPGSLGRERWLFVAGLVAFAVALSLRRLGDFDLPWHLATGRFITELRGIPRLDPLSYTHDRLTYVEPLTEVPLYWLIVIGGPKALQVAGGLVGAGIGFALFWQLRAQIATAYVAAALGLAAIYSWLVVRPATLSFLLIALELWVIEVHRRRAAERAGQMILLLFPIAVLLWANAHGFATIGAGLFACYACYRGVCRWARGRFDGLFPQRDAAAARATLLSAMASLLTSTLNLAGPTLRIGPNLLSSDTQSAFAFSAITEFASPSLEFFVHWEPLGAVVAAVALASLVPARGVDGRWNWPNAYDIGCVIAGVAGLSWVVRSVPLGVLVMLPVGARRLGAHVPNTVITRWGLASCSWLAAGFALLRIDTSVGFGFEPTHFPELAVKYISREKPQGRMWNFSPFGGYLAWRLYPEYLTFMDGRNTQAHSVSSVLRSSAAMYDSAQFVALTNEFEMQFAVMGAKDQAAFGIPLAQSPDWTMVHLDDVSAIYVRNGGANTALAARGYRMLRHLTAPFEVLNLAVKGDRLAPLLRDDGRLATTQDPTSARAAFFAAAGELAARDFRAFDLAVQRLMLLAPGHPAISALLQARAAVVPPS